MELECSKLEFHLKKKNLTARNSSLLDSSSKRAKNKSKELKFAKLEFHVFFFFFFSNLGQMNPRVNQVWETRFWVGTRVWQTQVPKIV